MKMMMMMGIYCAQKSLSRLHWELGNGMIDNNTYIMIPYLYYYAYIQSPAQESVKYTGM